MRQPPTLVRRLQGGQQFDRRLEQDPLAQVGDPQQQLGARWILPVSGGSARRCWTRRSEERAAGQMRDGVPLESGLVEAEILERLASWEHGNRARISTPDVSCAATFRDRTAARYSSWVRPFSRAWSVSLLHKSGVLSSPGVEPDLAGGFSGFGHQATCPSSSTTPKAP